MEVIARERISTDRIVVSPRPVWKCRSCENYGKNPACPPFVPSWEETRALVGRFREAELIKFGVDGGEGDKRRVMEFLLEVEREFFASGCHYATALFPGSCNLCERCSFDGDGRCLHPHLVRPSINAVGIELDSFVRIDFGESVLYGLVLVD